jgi:hypothetical protein|tara:strand:+ start:9259 stop:10026 length:768 start_codon:yes stop_codon:yes gene_type:complete
MARKTLLTEGEIRQFMKLARLAPIGAPALQEMGYDMPGARDEDHMEDELGATEDELGAEDEFADDEADELDVADDELADDDMDMSGMPDDERETLMADVVQAVADALGISDQVSIEAGTEGGDLDEPAVDDMMGGDEVDVDAMAMEPEMGGEEEVVVDDEEEVPMMEKAQGYDDKEDESLGMRTGKEADKEQSDKDRRDDSYGKFGKRGNKNESLSEDDLVAEVAKRVAARLQNNENREQMVDRLAERIMKRLTK